MKEEQGMKNKWMTLIHVIVTGLLLGSVAGAQIVSGNLVGRVADSSGAAVAGAEVELERAQGGVKRQLRTDESGGWTAVTVEPGLYRVQVKAAGFGSQVREALEVGANRSSRVDFTLSVANASETVTVSAEAGELQTDRSDRSFLLSKKEVVDLPVGGQRNFQNLLRLVPGVTPPRAANSLAGNPQGSLVVNVNGVSYAQNGNRIDGALNLFAALQHHAAFIPSAESIEAVNVVTNSFDAEQGLAGGAAVNVTVRSGSNAFHGGVWGFHTNSALRARNFFNFSNGIPKNILNQYGYRIGGPVMKDKLFFYTDFEGVKARESATTLASVATPAMRQGDFTQSGTTVYDHLTGAANGTGRTPYPGNRIPSQRFAAASQAMTALIPQPNLAGANNNYFASGSLVFDRDTFNTKINYFPVSQWNVFGRYSTFGSKVFDPPTLNEAGGAGITSVQPGNASGRTHSLVAGTTYSLRPNWIVDGYFGFTRQVTAGINVDMDKNYGLDVLKIPGTNGPNRLERGYPGFTVNGLTAFGNANVSNPYEWEDNLYVFAANTSYIQGKHSLRAGMEVTRSDINHYQPQGVGGGYTLRGSFIFSGGLTALGGGVAPNLFNAWGDFLLGLPQSMGKTTQFTIPSSVLTNTYAFFVRDQWTVSRRLSVNYGFRYEIYPFSTRGGLGLERYDPATDKVLIGGVGNTPLNTGIETGKGQFAPRAGLAYRISEKMVFRAGYGMSIDPYSYGVFMRNVFPTVLGARFDGVNSFQAAGSLVTGLPPVERVGTGNGVIAIPANFATSTVPQDFQRGYIHSFHVTLESRLPFGLLGEAAYVGTRSIRQIATLNLNAAGPGGGNNGRALALKFGRSADTNQLTPFGDSNYNAFQMGLQRPLRSGLQLRVAYTLSKAIGNNDNADSNLFYNWAPALGLNRAVAGYDRRHNFQLTGIYELPFGKGKPWMQGGAGAALLGGWSLSSALSLYSGTPFTVTASATSLNAPGNSQTADQVLGEVGMPQGVGLSASWFDPLAFRAVTAVRFGNSGRNILRGPGTANLDASVFRKFSIRERIEAQLRFEAFNVTNTPAFNNPNANVNSLSLNADGSVRALNGYSQISTAQASERQLRVALRITF
jgi:hypothetical protein